MTALLLALMAYTMTGQKLHEWLGAGLLLFFLIHLWLNARRIGNAGKGHYGRFRVLQTILALLCAVSMLGAMASGIWMSRYAFVFLPVHGGMAFARTAICSAFTGISSFCRLIWASIGAWCWVWGGKSSAFKHRHGREQFFCG